ncbi:SusD/RagB family nutrient-binding outer membrane lipoprotein, partial [Mesonia mobilis]|uniref:SusD/RagB family nutrient-binding outer membrane lipoprotein n=1 Tax=Mesonia mobilis TaxID=369791 RepID=UPI0026EE3B3F
SDQLIANDETILGDVIYDGDKLKWRKLINSYYLRILMNLSKKENVAELNIKNRFNEYNKKTSTLIKYYKDQNKFFPVNGHGSVDEITKRLFDLIDSFNLL